MRKEIERKDSREHEERKRERKREREREKERDEKREEEVRVEKSFKEEGVSRSEKEKESCSKTNNHSKKVINRRNNIHRSNVRLCARACRFRIFNI